MADDNVLRWQGNYNCHDDDYNTYMYASDDYGMYTVMPENEFGTKVWYLQYVSSLVGFDYGDVPHDEQLVLSVEDTMYDAMHFAEQHSVLQKMTA